MASSSSSFSYSSSSSSSSLSSSSPTTSTVTMDQQRSLDIESMAGKRKAADMENRSNSPAEQCERRILFVSGYRDIGRGQWQRKGIKYHRDNRDYVDAFLRMAGEIKYPLVVYVEPHIEQMLPQNLPEHISVLPLSYIHPCFVAKYAKQEQEIINSKEYQALVPASRKGLGEHSDARYNLVNHNKVLMVQDAARRYSGYSHIGWIDFGCVRGEKMRAVVPKDIDLGKLPAAKVLYQCLIQPGSSHYSPREMLSCDEIYFAGSMWVTPVNLAERYAALYDKILRQWHVLGVSDDDQNVVYQLFHDHPDMFASIEYPGWFRLYSECLKKDQAKIGFKEQMQNIKKKKKKKKIPKQATDDSANRTRDREVDELRGIATHAQVKQSNSRATMSGSAYSYTIVVARYNESIEWLQPEMDHCIVYNKGLKLGIPSESPLENVGRESHTYLTYIIEHYDVLPDVVVFTQARISDHCSGKAIDYIRRLRGEAFDKGKSEPSWKAGTNPKGPWRPDWNFEGYLPDGKIKWYFGPPDNRAVYFNNQPVVFRDWFVKHIRPEYPQPTAVYENGLFAVTRTLITSRPKEDYRRLLALVSHNVNPVEGHFFERSWFYIFE